jgi:hypothetical protein
MVVDYFGTIDDCKGVGIFMRNAFSDCYFLICSKRLKHTLPVGLTNRGIVIFLRNFNKWIRAS